MATTPRIHTTKPSYSLRRNPTPTSKRAVDDYPTANDDHVAPKQHQRMSPMAALIVPSLLLHKPNSVLPLTPSLGLKRARTRDAEQG